MSESDPEFEPEFCSKCGHELTNGSQIVNGRPLCALCCYIFAFGHGDD